MVKSTKQSEETIAALTDADSLKLRRSINLVAAKCHDDHQETRKNANNRVRAILRNADMGIRAGTPEAKIDPKDKKYQKDYADKNFPDIIARLLKEGKISKPNKQALDRFLVIAKQAAALENSLKSPMRRVLSAEAVWNRFLKYVRGVGPITASKLLAIFGDFERFSRISSVIRYAGLHVVCPKCTTEVPDKRKIADGEEDATKTISSLCGPDGKCIKCGANGVGAKKIAGRSIDFKPELRELMYNTATCLIRCGRMKDDGTVFTGMYDAYKTRQALRKFASGVLFEKFGAPYTQDSTEFTPLHIHMMALRKISKVFLGILWVVSRLLTGQDVTNPYVQEQLGHPEKHMLTWEDVLRDAGVSPDTLLAGLEVAEA